MKVTPASGGPGGAPQPVPRAQAPHPTLLDVKNVSLSFGGVKAIRDVSFDIRQG